MKSKKKKEKTQWWFGMLVVLILFLIPSCAKPEDSADGSSQVWVPEFLSFEMEETSYSHTAFLEDSFYYISCQQQEEGFRYNLSGCSLTDGPLPDLPLNWQDGKGRFVTLFALGQEAEVYLIAYLMEEDGSRMHLCKFDAEGNLAYDVDISEETDQADLLAVDDRGRVYIAGSDSGNPCVQLYTEEGKYKGTILLDIPNGTINAMGTDRNGVMYVCCRTNGGYVGSDFPSDQLQAESFLMEIDFDQEKTGTSYLNFPNGDNSLLLPGSEKTLLSYDRTTLYAYDLTAKTSKALFDWLDCDINGSYVTAVNMLEDGRILAVSKNFSESRCELALLKKVDSTQTVQKETIVLGTFSSTSALRNAVMEFNRENDTYHVKIKEYLDPQTHDRADATVRMNNDILSDSCPDILDLADLNLNALASKGLFADLNDYLENSSLLKRSDILDSLLTAYTIENKLITIPSHFSLKTLMGWRSAVGDDMGWTLEELITYAEAHPEAELFDNTSRDEIIQYLMSYNENAFIDWHSGTCHFDSDNFKQLLKFAGRFPAEPPQSPEQSSTPVRIQNGEVLLLEVNLVDFDSIQLPLEIYRQEGICIGFPSPEGSAGTMLIPYGAYAITVTSRQKEGAWAFIEYLLSSENNSSSFFPPTKARLAEKAADAVKVEYLIDENGKLCLDQNGEPVIKNTGMSISYSDWEYTYRTTSQEEVDIVLNLIATAKPVFCSEESEITAIITEEAESYYQGQKSLEEAVNVIQSRIQVYIHEN